MSSRPHRWPAWLLVLLVGGWVSVAHGEAAQETTGDPNDTSAVSASTDNEIDVSAEAGESHEEGTPTSSTAVILPALDTSIRIPALVQQWLKHQATGISPSSAPGSETLSPYRIGDPLVESPALPIAPAVAVGPVEPLEPPPISHLTVMLDWYPSPRHAALLVAQERELFTQRGLKVDILTPADPEVLTKLLAAGRIDLALTRQPLLHLLADEDKPLIRIASLIRLPLSFLLVSDAAQRGSLADLGGARIGHLDEDGERVLLAALLASQNLTPDQVDSPKVHFSVEKDMREGHIDAIIGAMQHQLAEMLANDGLSTHEYRVETFGVPLHDGLIVVANRDRLVQKRDAIRHFVDALEEATAWILNDPDASWSLLAEAEPGMDTRFNHQAWPEVRARLSLSPAALSQGRYIDFEQYLLDAGIVESITPVHRLALDLGAEKLR